MCGCEKSSFTVLRRKKKVSLEQSRCRKESKLGWRKIKQDFGDLFPTWREREKPAGTAVFIKKRELSPWWRFRWGEEAI